MYTRIVFKSTVCVRRPESRAEDSILEKRGWGSRAGRIPKFSGGREKKKPLTGLGYSGIVEGRQSPQAAVTPRGSQVSQSVPSVASTFGDAK